MMLGIVKSIVLFGLQRQIDGIGMQVDHAQIDQYVEGTLLQIHDVAVPPSRVTSQSSRQGPSPISSESRPSFARSGRRGEEKTTMASIFRQIRPPSSPLPPDYWRPAIPSQSIALTGATMRPPLPWVRRSPRDPSRLPRRRRPSQRRRRRRRHRRRWRRRRRRRRRRRPPSRNRRPHLPPRLPSPPRDRPSSSSCRRPRSDAAPSRRRRPRPPHQR